MSRKLTFATLIAILFARSLPLQAEPVISPCPLAFNSSGMIINSHGAHDAFFSSGSVVKHISKVTPGSGPCGFGPLLPDINLGPGTNVSRGLAVDGSGNLFVAAGHGAATNILKIAAPYNQPPVVFFSQGKNVTSLAIRGHALYAADFGAGVILEFNLNDVREIVTTFAKVPGVFGIFAAGKDDLFVTSNAGGGGSNDVQHVTRRGISKVATGLGFPEGISGDDENLYIASNAVVVRVPRSGGKPASYAGAPIQFSHATFVFRDAGYVADSNRPGHIFKFSLREDESQGD